MQEVQVGKMMGVCAVTEGAWSEGVMELAEEDVPKDFLDMGVPINVVGALEAANVVVSKAVETCEGKKSVRLAAGGGGKEPTTGEVG